MGVDRYYGVAVLTVLGSKEGEMLVNAHTPREAAIRAAKHFSDLPAFKNDFRMACNVYQKDMETLIESFIVEIKKDMGQLREFWFNTGVRVFAHDKPVPCSGEFEFVGEHGVKQIKFFCENVPQNARFMYACDNPDNVSARTPGVIVRPIVKGGLASKYAYFKIEGQ